MILATTGGTLAAIVARWAERIAHLDADQSAARPGTNSMLAEVTFCDSVILWDDCRSS